MRDEDTCFSVRSFRNHFVHQKIILSLKLEVVLESIWPKIPTKSKRLWKICVACYVPLVCVIFLLNTRIFIGEMLFPSVLLKNLSMLIGFWIIEIYLCSLIPKCGYVVNSVVECKGNKHMSLLHNHINYIKSEVYDPSTKQICCNHKVGVFCGWYSG